MKRSNLLSILLLTSLSIVSLRAEEEVQEGFGESLGRAVDTFFQKTSLQCTNLKDRMFASKEIVIPTIASEEYESKKTELDVKMKERFRLGENMVDQRVFIVDLVKSTQEIIKNTDLGSNGRQYDDEHYSKSIYIAAQCANLDKQVQYYVGNLNDFSERYNTVSQQVETLRQALQNFEDEQKAKALEIEEGSDAVLEESEQAENSLVAAVQESISEVPEIDSHSEETN